MHDVAKPAPVTLTPEMIARFCERHLSAAEARFVAETILNRGERFLVAQRALAPEGFHDDVEVAQWILRACRATTGAGAA